MRDPRRSTHVVSCTTTASWYEVSRVGAARGRGQRIVREICRANDFGDLAARIRRDHVHVLESALQHLKPSRMMQAIMGRRRIAFSKIIGGCGRSVGRHGRKAIFGE